MTDDDGIEATMATATCENPYLLTRPLPTTQSRSTSGDGTRAVHGTAPSEKRLSTLPLVSIESALALAPGEAPRSSEVAQQLTKRRKTLTLSSSEAAWRSNKIDRQSTKQGEQTAEIAQTWTKALTSSEAAWQSSKIAWDSIEEKQRSTEKARTQKKGKIPKVRKEVAENQTSSISTPLIAVTGPQDDNRGRNGSQSPSLQPSFTRPPTSDGIKSINPPGKRKRGDYEGLISCRPSDKLWKFWESKHLLRSYAAGSSFAQISASREFSNGLVIRSEKECQERYKTLNEWQQLQDKELLRIGETEANEDFARICSVSFSRGLVKRSAEQCKERFEFLRKSEFEGF